MNKRGFTLVELLATIVLLSIISVISYVSISSVIKKNKVNNCRNLIKSIEGASREYISDNRYNFTNRDDKVITAEDLFRGNYLKNEIMDPFTNEKVNSENVKIIISLKSDYTMEKIQIKGYDFFENNCNLG